MLQPCGSWRNHASPRREIEVVHYGLQNCPMSAGMRFIKCITRRILKSVQNSTILKVKTETVWRLVISATLYTMKRGRCQNTDTLLTLPCNFYSLNYQSPKSWVRIPSCPCLCFVFIWQNPQLLTGKFACQFSLSQTVILGNTNQRTNNRKLKSLIQWNSSTIFCLIFGQRQDKYYTTESTSQPYHPPFTATDEMQSNSAANL